MAAAVLALHLSEPVVAQGLPRGDAPWVTVRARHFTVVGNARETDAVAVAENLERFHSLLEQIRPARSDQSLPTLVFAFRNAGTFRNYSPWPERDDIAGYYLPGRYRNYVALDLSPREEAAGTIYHEYVHQFVADSFPEVPLWFNEGLAEYYSNFAVERGEALVGRPIAAHLEWLRLDGLMPVAELLAVTHESPVYNESERAGIFYAQSWATVHYLFSDPERASKVVRYLDAIGAGRDVDAAYREAFGGDYAALERELERYVASRRFRFLRVPLAAVGEAAAEASPLPIANALAELGDFLANHLPPRPEQAAAHFDAALALDPVQPIALAGRALLLEQAGDLDGAIAELERVAGLVPEHPHPALLLGLAGIEKLRQHGLPETPIEQQASLARRSRAALERVLAAAPGFGLAQATLGLTYLWDGDPRAGIDVLLEARRAAPSRPDLYFGLAVLAARVDAFGDAWLAADALARVEAAKPAVLAQPEMVQAAGLAVAELQLRRAARLLEAGEEQQALDLAADLDARLARLAKSGGADVRPFVEGVVQLRAYVRRSVSVRVLQAAVERANRGELEPALEQVERVLADGVDDDDVRARAEELRGFLLRALGRPPGP